MATGEARRDLWRYSCLAVAGTGVVAIGVARGRPASGPAILANSLLVVIAWAAGWAVRSTRQLAASRVSLEHEQAARRLSENRLAMSDVLHDRVGHTLVGVLRQLEAAQALFEVDPVGAGTLIERVTGRVGEAMGEVSAMVVQNQELPAARAELAPTPGGGGVLGDTLGR
ncbi:MAG: histidine kinase, partial [Ferrimicrobium sp.]|nr:histidine kinase [Ferrimicrobium sp.]